MKRLVLGLDGGGTKVHAAVAGLDGAILGEGWGGVCNVASTPITEALKAVDVAVNVAFQVSGVKGEVVAVCAGVAGVSYEARRLEFEAALTSRYPRAAVQVVPDYAIALTAGIGEDRQAADTGPFSSGSGDRGHCRYWIGGIRRGWRWEVDQDRRVWFFDRRCRQRLRGSAAPCCVLC